MLEDDELDFEDFGDLEDYENQGLTTEELEKQLALEFADIPETLEKKDAVVDLGELDEGEIVQDPTEKNHTKPENPSMSEKIIEQPIKPKQNNFNNNNAYKNFYNQQQQQYTPDMMPMNNMFPYPQYSNRIYVNPKFNGGNQQQLHQLAQQRQYMEMEAKRMALLQHQQQLLMHNTRKEQRAAEQRATELDQKRKETAEMMRKRRESKNIEIKAGEKRKERDSPEPDFEPKHIPRQSPAGGISIKGAAARANQSSSSPSSSPRNAPYTPPHQQRPENTIRNRITQPTNISNRLGQPQDKHSATSITENSYIVPIVTGGKSNTLNINGFKTEIKDQDIKNMTKDVPGGVKDVKIDMDTKTATIVFPTVEAAVTFRRKYNRYQIGESRINVVFKK